MKAKCISNDKMFLLSGTQRFFLENLPAQRIETLHTKKVLIVKSFILG